MQAQAGATVIHAHGLVGEILAQRFCQSRIGTDRPACNGASLAVVGHAQFDVRPRQPASAAILRYGPARCARRAGTCAAPVRCNSSRTSTVVPGACARGVTSPIFPPSICSAEPCSSCARREARVKRLTEAIDGSASPRKPSVATDSRSSRSAILLVAWRDTASGSCSGAMPLPLSRMRIRRTPPSSRSISTRLAPASIAFSTSSLTTEAGRSTTSPAAIWLIRSPARAGSGADRARSWEMMGSRLHGSMIAERPWIDCQSTALRPGAESPLHVVD